MITGSGGGKVGDGVNGSLLIELSCVLFLQDIGGVKFSASGGAFGFLPLVVRCCEESFEANSSFLLSG